MGLGFSENLTTIVRCKTIKLMSVRNALVHILISSILSVGIFGGLYTAYTYYGLAKPNGLNSLEEFQVTQIVKRELDSERPYTIGPLMNNDLEATKAGKVSSTATRSATPLSSKER